MWLMFSRSVADPHQTLTLKKGLLRAEKLAEVIGLSVFHPFCPVPSYHAVVPHVGGSSANLRIILSPALRLLAAHDAERSSKIT